MTETPTGPVSRLNLLLVRQPGKLSIVQILVEYPDTDPAHAELARLFEGKTECVLPLDYESSDVSFSLPPTTTAALVEAAPQGAGKIRWGIDLSAGVIDDNIN